jgi:phage gp37-like protein
MDGNGNGFSEERLARIHEIINRRKNGSPVPFERVREVLDDFYYGLAFEAGIDKGVGWGTVQLDTSETL